MHLSKVQIKVFYLYLHWVSWKWIIFACIYSSVKSYWLIFTEGLLKWVIFTEHLYFIWIFLTYICWVLVQNQSYLNAFLLQLEVFDLYLQSMSYKWVIFICIYSSVEYFWLISTENSLKKSYIDLYLWLHYKIFSYLSAPLVRHPGIRNFNFIKTFRIKSELVQP